MSGPVTAYNWVQGTTAAIVGPSRARLRQIVIFAAAAGEFTLKDGSASGDVLLTQKFPTGHHVMNIPDNGIIFKDGVFVAAFTGSTNQLTIFLS
jgi:hypothetical protein